MKAVALILSLLITMPIWYYLLYKILIAVNATDLMWFLYVAYIPVGFVSHICVAISNRE